MKISPEKIREIADKCHAQLGFPYNGFLELYTTYIVEETMNQLLAKMEELNISFDAENIHTDENKKFEEFLDS